MLLRRVSRGLFRASRRVNCGALLVTEKKFYAQAYTSKADYPEAEKAQTWFVDEEEEAIKKLLRKIYSDNANEVVTPELKALVNKVNSAKDLARVSKLAVKISSDLNVFGNPVGHMFKKPLVRVAITGAAGNIGYSLLPRIASGEMLGYDQPIALHLIEIPEAEKALEGVKMELQDCAFPLVREIVTTSDLKVGFKDVDYVLLVGGKPRTKGMERKDLLLENAKIFAEQGKALNENAKKTCLTLVVGNPANTNALILSSHAPNIPKENISAMMRLDHDRAIAQLAKKLKTPVRDIKNVFVLGNHSSTQVPDVTHAKTSTGVKVSVPEDWMKNEFIPTIQQRGAAIINARGASSAFSAADAAIKHMKDWVLGSNEIVSMAVPSDGTYGVASGVYCGYPVRCKGNGKYEIVKDLQLSDFVKQKLGESVKELLSEKSAVKSMLK